MSRPTISTGSIDFSTGKQAKNKAPRNAAPQVKTCHIAILGDFSGRGHRDTADVTGLANRKMIEVDRDNLEEIFERLKVTLDTPLADGPMTFREMDDLHPDFIYERIPLFDRFKNLRKRLKNSSTFDEAAQEVQSWATSKSSSETAKQSQVAAADDSKEAQQANGQNDAADESLLDQLLGAPIAKQTSEEFDVKQLVRDIMEPYLIPRPDPRQDELLASVDESTSQLMRKILHNSDFQKIEASWRSLYLLTKQLETDSKLKVFIMDVSRQELLDDAEAWAAGESGGLHKRLVEKRQVEGQDAFAMLLADYQFTDSEIHVAGLRYLAELGAATGAGVLTGGNERIAGTASLAKQPDSDDWNYRADPSFLSAWQSFRQTEESQFLSLLAPRFLLRLPYGKKYSHVESFSFEELPVNNPHHYYLWGNSAWLAVLLLGKSYSQFGWSFQPGAIQEVDKLPIHVMYDADGDAHVTPCAEINMTDRTAAKLVAAGLSVVRSVMEKDKVVVPDIRSSHLDSSTLKGPWQDS